LNDNHAHVEFKETHNKIDLISAKTDGRTQKPIIVISKDYAERNEGRKCRWEEM
jgi:hypothetical protein